MKGNEPAFPGEHRNGGVRQQGMSYREWLAGLAMQGMSSNPVFDNAEPETIAKCAVQQADALIAELEKNKDD